MKGFDNDIDIDIKDLKKKKNSPSHLPVFQNFFF